MENSTGMNKKLKYILYIAGCAIIFSAFVLIFKSPFHSNSANAFEWDKPVNIYFLNANMGSGEDCSKVFPVSRTILNAETLGPGALEALLKGVSEKEKASGYSTSINSNVLVQKFEIRNKVAYVDFNSSFNDGVAGSCRVQAIKSQIEKTLAGLSDISSVVISVDGKTEGILEP